MVLLLFQSEAGDSVSRRFEKMGGNVQRKNYKNKFSVGLFLRNE